MDCKRALEENQGDIDKALETLRKKGLAGAANRAGRTTQEGTVCSYVHHGGKVGVLVEVNCETDFVARTPEFQNLAKEVALQIAAAAPTWVRIEDVPAATLAKEKEIYVQQAAQSGKPAAALPKIVEGKLTKFYNDFCLLEQAHIRDTSGKTKVKDVIALAIADMKENITIRRFVRFQVGEDI